MNDDGALSKENALAASGRMKAGVEEDSSEWVCPQCKKRFALLSEWRQHVQSPHVEGKQFQCWRVECFDWFATRDERERHEILEHGDRPDAADYEVAMLDAAGNFRHPTRAETWRQFVITFPSATVGEWLEAVTCILAPGWK